MPKGFDKIWALARIAMGFTFLWAFFDKWLGLGFATCFDAKTKLYLGPLCSASWLEGGSPTMGFLKFGAKGPLAPVFNTMATSQLVEWLFMLGLLGVGLGLMLGVVNKIASTSAIAMLFFMYLALLWPENNPFLDDHIYYIIILLGFIVYNPGKTWGLGNWWSNMSIVKKFPILE